MIANQEIEPKLAESITITDSLVEFRADSYIPFEPKRESVEMNNRAMIRSAVKYLNPGENDILLAQFGNFSGTDWFFDLENILFYNIGTSYFDNACKNGIAFCQMKSRADSDSKFVYRYETTNVENISIPDKVFAEWLNIPFDKFNASLKPIDYWKRFKENWNNVKISTENKVVGDFGIQLHITLAKGKQINIATAMKPMLDGIICAFHPANQDLSSFCEALSCPKEQLAGDEKCILQPREYIYHYRGGIKWNPEDDKCKFVIITLSQGDTHSTYISGQIFEQ